MNTYFRKSCFAVCLIFTLTSNFVVAENYSSDLEDIEWSSTKIGIRVGYKGAHKDVIASAFTPIGSLGDIERVVDIRGFFPFSACSHKEQTKFFNFTDHMRIFQLPTKDGILMSFYGTLEESVMKEKFAKTIFTTEQALEKEDLSWTKFGYEFAKSGEKLFQGLGYGWGFDSCEPVSVVFTPTNVLLFMNFKYSDLDRKGTGQVISVFDFSRALKEYKTVYEIHSTTILSPGTANAFKGSSPIVIELAKAFFFH